MNSVHEFFYVFILLLVLCSIKIIISTSGLFSWLRWQLFIFVMTVEYKKPPNIKSRPAERFIKTFPGKCLLKGNNWSFPKAFSDRAERFSLQRVTRFSPRPVRPLDSIVMWQCLCPSSLEVTILSCTVFVSAFSSIVLVFANNSI